jgi:hypothetical protein
MRPKKDRMTELEKAMRIRKEFAISDWCRTAVGPEAGKISFAQLLSGANQRLVRIFVLCFSTVVCVGFSGCGGSSVKPDVGPITVTNINGVAQPTVKSLTVGGGTYLDVTLTNDKSFLGADWTVSCGSALAPGTPLPPGKTVDTSCGYFTPIHTASAPVPAYAENADGIVTYYTAPAAPPKAGTVTLYASASADHSQFSALTLVVAGVPISVAIVASTPPPFTLPVSGTMSLTGTLTNDYTVGGGYISWSLSCQSSDCGSLSATKTATGTAVTYTAPATVPTGNAVMVTATSVTDPTVSNSIIITIT